MRKLIWTKGFHLSAFCGLLSRIKKIVKFKGLLLNFQKGTFVIGWMYREDRDKQK